jgi:hypothetical protein
MILPCNAFTRPRGNGSKRVCGPKNDKDAEAIKKQTGDDIY